MSLTDFDSHQHLLRAIDDLFILVYYEDLSRVGKDDYNRDYMIVSNFSDIYIRDCVKSVMLKYCKSFASPHVEGDYVLKCLESYDNNGLARYPRSGYLFEVSDQSYTKLWFLKQIISFYDAEEHRKCCETEKNNQFHALDYDYEVIETLISKEYSSTKITCKIAHRTNLEDSSSYVIETVDKEPDIEKIEDFCMYLKIENQLKSQS